MTDWRQIQARIRKARGSSDPSGQLSALYEHTHDAMVAFELARVYEKAGAPAEAIRWYTSAAERFRRAQWKQKAEEALARLGAPIPTTQVSDAADAEGESPSPLHAIVTEVSEEQEMSQEILQAAPDSNRPAPEIVFEEPQAAAPEASAPETAAAVETPAARKRKRRGRRGGRGRNKARHAGADTPSANTASAAPAARERAAESHTVPAAAPASLDAAERRVREPLRERVSERMEEPAAGEEIGAPEPAGVTSALQSRVRSGTGDPGLSSRLAKLESQLRRLLACSAHSVEQPENAPAGPGVFLITDTDQASYYYIESCQTLRVGIGNLLRGGRGSREGANLKEKLAEHLGINESRVSKYLKDNCAVRWLQLDEGASRLAHFAIAVLHPIANE